MGLNIKVIKIHGFFGCLRGDRQADGENKKPLTAKCYKWLIISVEIRGVEPLTS